MSQPTEPTKDVPQQDLEAQTTILPQKIDSDAAEYSYATRTKFISLGFWFFFNLTLTIQSKMLLGKFDFPYLLTAFHTGTTAAGCTVLMLQGQFKPKKLVTREKMILAAFSTLFTINIAISNASLSLVSVAFHQILRSTVPFFTIVIYRLYFGRTYSTQTYISLIPIMLGVGMVTYGDYNFTVMGFSLTLLGVILAALKGIVSNRLMTGSLALSSMEFLYRMSPLAAVQALLYAALTGELSRFYVYAGEGNMTNSRMLGLFTNSLIAFFLNLSSFHTNKVAGALTMTVCGNIKQVLTIILGILIFDVHIGGWNGVGIVVTLAGAAYYSKVELRKKLESKADIVVSEERNAEEKEILLSEGQR